MYCHVSLLQTPHHSTGAARQSSRFAPGGSGVENPLRSTKPRSGVPARAAVAERDGHRAAGQSRRMDLKTCTGLGVFVPCPVLAARVPGRSFRSARTPGDWFEIRLRPPGFDEEERDTSFIPAASSAVCPEHRTFRALSCFFTRPAVVPRRLRTDQSCISGCGGCSPTAPPPGSGSARFRAVPFE